MKLSLRVVQTLLFVAVVLVAMAIVWLNLFSAIEKSVSQITVSNLRQKAGELSHHVSRDFSVYKDEASFKKHFEAFAETYDDDFWVFDTDGRILVSKNAGPNPGSVLPTAKRTILAGDDYAAVRQRLNLVFAGQPFLADKKRAGGVLIASTLTPINQVVGVARQEVAIAFLAALALSALLALVFSFVIARQVRQLSEGALAMSQGKFDLRVGGPLFPKEVSQLANSLNVMARELGKAFQALEGQRKELSTVISFMSEGVMEIEERGTIRLVNPAASNLLGMPTDELVGRTVAELPNAASLVNSVETATQGNDSASIWDTNDQSLLIQSTPIHEDGHIKGCVVVVGDVTQQRKVEQVQREFVANASHELRTPITSLRGFVELLEDGAHAKPDVRMRFLRSIRRQVDRLQRLVDQLFALTQFDIGKFHLEPTQASVKEIVGEVVATCKPIAEERGVSLTTRLEGGLPNVFCDKDRIVQVLIGFVDNSLKHCSAGSTATIIAEIKPNQGVCLGVKDDGPGMPADVLSRVFDRFYQAPNQSQKVEGAGLGLSIAKEIIQAHGSRIKVESLPGKGSTFSFVLPVP